MPHSTVPAGNVGTRERLHRAALHLVDRHGPAASVRAIAREAGVTEGALYRHYPSREHLLAAVYVELVAPMIAEKENLVAMRVPMRDRLREWIRCTYVRFDRDPAAFAYIFLTQHDLPADLIGVSAVQSSLFKRLVEDGKSLGEIGDIPTDLASAIFVGLLLTVPAQIRRGSLAGPAEQHVDEIARVAWLALGPTQT